jgi:hypothetical protein
MELAIAGTRVYSLAVGVVLAAVASKADEGLLRMAETNDGMVFSVRTTSIKAHRLGHSAEIRGWSPHPKKLRASEDDSPRYQRVESTWVVVCEQGTFSTVENRFYDRDGNLVATVGGSADDQESPVYGSVASMILRNLCFHLYHR